MHARATEIRKMTTVTIIDEIHAGLNDIGMSPLRSSLRRWNVGLIVSALFGTALGVGGLTIGFLTFGEFILPNTSLYTISTVLIGASFVFFGLAAHCLDKADAAEKAVRLEYCRNHGLQDEDCRVESETR